MEYIEVSAKTIDDALTEASIKLGTTSDKLEYEVIDKGSNGFLGIGSRDAVIKVKNRERKMIINKPHKLRFFVKRNILKLAVAGNLFHIFSVILNHRV